MAELHDRRPRLTAGTLWLMLSPTVCFAFVMATPLIFHDKARATIVAFPVYWVGKAIAFTSLIYGGLVILDKDYPVAARVLVLVFAVLNASYLIGALLWRLGLIRF